MANSSSNVAEVVPQKESKPPLDIVDCKTPPPENAVKVEGTQSSPAANPSSGQKCKPSPGLSTPDRLKVPKPFKYPERYTSPTDHMISPISKGILARSRRGGSLLPPSLIRSKIHELGSQDVGQIRLKMGQ